MNNFFSTNMEKFNQLSMRERALIAITVLVVLIGGWLHFYAQPIQSEITLKSAENDRFSSEINASRITIAAIKSRIEEGVHRQEEDQLVQLRDDLKNLENQLRLKTVELIEPAQMFDLISELIYQDSKLKLQALRREDVRPAIPLPEGQEQPDQGQQIFRHVMAVEFSGSYLDVLGYIEQLEELNWRLIWDEIEILSEDYPTIRVRLVMSTLSTNREWVGV